MNRLADDFFAGAVLAQDQDIGIGWGGAGNGTEHFEHGGRCTDDVGAAMRGRSQAAIERSELRGFPARAAELKRGTKRRQ
jgi:hypothetical protein